jgi:hypothetical protein
MLEAVFLDVHRPSFSERSRLTLSTRVPRVRAVVKIGSATFATHLYIQVGHALPLGRLLPILFAPPMFNEKFRTCPDEMLLAVSHCCLTVPDSTLHILSLVVILKRRSFRPPHQSKDQVDCSPCRSHMVSQLCQTLGIYRVVPVVI